MGSGIRKFGVRNLENLELENRVKKPCYGVDVIKPS